jgi:hypothetical protein
MKPIDPTVNLYEEGHFITPIRFRHKWQAWLFHVMLNKSLDHRGMRLY